MPLTDTIPSETADQVVTNNALDGSLELLARHLAGTYVLSSKSAGEPVLLSLLQTQEQFLTRAHKQFYSTMNDDVNPSSAAEWLLDNFYVVEQAIRQIREDMPAGYYQLLPKLNNTSLAGYPRIYALANETVIYSNYRLDMRDTASLIRTFQADGVVLTIGELWAFPTMLRLSILDSLTRALIPFLETDPLVKDVAIASAPPISDESVVGNCITSLRTVAVQDWKAFFESISVVDQVLGDDPADIYLKMDFDTRNSYRTAIEHVARKTKQAEVNVARQVITLSTEAVGLPETHIGYYLIGEGRRQLESAFLYRPDWSERLRRWLLDHPTRVYLGSIGLFTTLAVVLVCIVSILLSAFRINILGVALLTFLPFTAVAVTLVNWIVTHNISPRLLPRLDFSEGVPVDYQTMVVIPTLLTDAEEIDSLLQQLELHYLRNTDPTLYFALLTDFSDAATHESPDDTVLISRAQSGIIALNEKYERENPPFYLFHRERQWNATQGCWMGWERKRGKLMEFNQLLRGHQSTSYTVTEGNLRVLSHVKYVITLDADSILPEDSASRLIATLAHPLNRAQYDPVKGVVVSGYAILQPRIEVKPTSANQSLFTRIFAGDIGLDLYTHAVSDTYQDLFGEGSYVGKGIYDVDVFEASVANRIPENALLSHDLFEGIHARVALVTDIVLLEEYPARYLSHTRRLHRWIRGDWQLLPWLLPRIPTGSAGQAPPTVLSLINRWKILDNLRRSLLSPALLILFISSWMGFIGGTNAALVWTLVGIATLGFPLFLGMFTSLTQPSKTATWGETLRSLRMDVWRWVLALVFLPYEAVISVDAIGVTLHRIFIRRSQLLQWTTAASTARLFGHDRGSEPVWREMITVPVLVGVITVLIGLFNPSCLLIALPLLVVWAVSPQIAYWISRPTAQSEMTDAVSPEQEESLRHLARQTWLFFEQMVGPEDHWLPPDHFQEEPRTQIAHRTSPTNIGMLILSTLSAYDLGYIGILDLSVRLQATLDTVEGMERYRGHLLNWYDTQTLEALSPRYVSTVDSGNWAGSLITMKQACLTFPDTVVIPAQRWTGLLDTLGLLQESLTDLLKRNHDAPVIALHAYTDSLRQQIQAVLNTPDQWTAFLAVLNDYLWVELSGLIVAVLETESDALNADSVSNLRITADRVHHHLRNMQRDTDLFMPWLIALNQPPVLFTRADRVTRADHADSQTALLTDWHNLLLALPKSPHLHELAEICVKGYDKVTILLSQLQASQGRDGQDNEAQIAEAILWCGQLAAKLLSSEVRVQTLLTAYQALADRAEAHFLATDFSFLFNTQRKVFYIGYNVTVGKLDDNCYDLLASEARLGSLLAIAKRDVPQNHWLHLARPITSVVNTRTLLSWSGTMFEYLMPALLMESYEQTFLTQSCRAAVDYQIAYALEKNVPWGISESSYNAFDGNLTYQYQAFGVQGLGFKRGLADDLVITPYASLLALYVRPQAVQHNMTRLDGIGMRGRYGYYESVDYSPSRLAPREEFAIVRSYMAHHQGMILVSLANCLMSNVMIQRFHADPAVQSVEMLLQERIPTQAPVEYPHQTEVIAHAMPPSHVTLAPWSVPVDAALPQVHVLSNGRYTTMITSAGGGYSQWQGIGLTRWQADTTRDDWGSWIYLRDQDTGDLWSAGYQPTGVTPDDQQALFYPHQAEFRRRDHGIVLHMQITVAPDDDVEIRQITLINDSDQQRRLQVTSYSEVLLAQQNEQHPAFNKLFVDSEYLADSSMQMFHRRQRTPNEALLYVAHVAITDAAESVSSVSYLDKRAFIGRGRTAQSPAALSGNLLGASSELRGTHDQIMSLGNDLILEPHSQLTIAYLTVVAPSHDAAVILAERYKSWSLIAHTFESARRVNELALRQVKLDASQLALFQQLLGMLLYPSARMRASLDILLANTKGQSGLWANSISGDYPILLVCLNDASELALVQDVLLAHNYWHNQQLMIDLVILNRHDSSYSQEVQGQLHRMILRSNNGAWLNRRGGIFIVNADQMNEADRILLQTVARVVLDSGLGSLAEQLALTVKVQPQLPIFTPAPSNVSNTQNDEFTPPLLRPDDLCFSNGLGGFSPDGKEYVIYLESGQWTPAPWVNVIANESFGFLVSETGMGYTWSENSSQNRLTPWGNDPVSDSSGEALYLRDEETAEVWSPMPLSARNADPYLIRHGAGYSQFDHHSQGLKQTTRLYIAPDAPVKIIKLRLENMWQRPRRITVTYYAEWVLGVTRAASQPFIVQEYDHESGTLLARNAYNVDFGDRVAFLSASKAPHGLTTDRTEFLGRMGNMSHPAALNRIGLSSRVEAGGDPCAALQVHIDLPAGGVEEVFFLLGEGANREEALSLVQRYKREEATETAWQTTHQFWNRILGTVTVKTPDVAMNVMLNRWLLYQTLSCRIWGRTGFYQSSGAFGYRDQLQDVMALVLSSPTLARDHILRAARHQFEAGDVLHWWHPPADRGVRTRFSDDLLWLPYVTGYYVGATGDNAILDESIPFLRGDALKPDEEERYGQYDSTGESYTLYEHCIRAIKRGSTEGSHGLPLMGTGDWNDGMNRVGIQGRGESVWVGWFLTSVLSHIIPLCEQRGDLAQARAFTEQAARLREALNREAWDGQWYRRAYYDDGTPLGSAQSEECQIDSIVQSWAVLSGAGQTDHAKQAMSAVKDRLVRTDDQLVLLFTPPFNQTSHDPGYIKGYPPGIRENGGQYTHAATWVAWAFAELGDGNQSMELFKLLNPISHSDTLDKAIRYQVEPYVIAADVYGVAPYTGQGGWTWYTGSASWMYRLGIEAILGLKRVGDSLIITPCIPDNWAHYEMSYRNEATLHVIHVDNPQHISQGVVQITFDGAAISGGLIPLRSDGETHQIQIVIVPHSDS